MKVLFDGRLLDSNHLQDVYVQKSTADAEKFDVVAQDGETVRVLSTHDTENDAKAFVNKLGKKLMDVEFQDVIDMTE